MHLLGIVNRTHNPFHPAWLADGRTNLAARWESAPIKCHGWRAGRVVLGCDWASCDPSRRCSHSKTDQSNLVLDTEPSRAKEGAISPRLANRYSRFALSHRSYCGGRRAFEWEQRVERSQPAPLVKAWWSVGKSHTSRQELDKWGTWREIAIHSLIRRNRAIMVSNYFAASSSSSPLARSTEWPRITYVRFVAGFASKVTRAGDRCQSGTLHGGSGICHC